MGHPCADTTSSFVVSRCCTYIAGLQNSQYASTVSRYASPSSKVVEVPSPISDASSASEVSSPDTLSEGSASDVVRHHQECAPNATQVLNPTDATRAIYALSTSVDRLFEHAANTLSSDALVSMLESLAEASADQLVGGTMDVLLREPHAVVSVKCPLSSNLHFCRMIDVVLRCTRDARRPLLHLMKVWSTVSRYFVKVTSYL